MASNYNEICKRVFDLPEFQQTNWVVITGPPSSGKTTLINELSKLGYATNPDITREYLVEMLNKGIPAVKAREDEALFQKTIFILMIKNALSLDKVKLIFNDYFLPDNIPYLNLFNISIPPEYTKSAQLFLFKKVFICSPLTLIKDDIRTETVNEQHLLYNLIIETYRNIGCETILLPALSVKERLQIILDNVK